MKRKREPRTPNGAKEMPAEVAQFLDATQKRAAGLVDADGWLVELSTLRSLSEQLNLGLHDSDPNSVEVDGMIVQHGFPVLECFSKSDDGFRLPPERLPAWIIDANATDADIMANVKRALEDRRKFSPPPISKSGPNAPNNDIDGKTFEMWQRNRIVEFGYLLAWRKELPDRQRRYPEHCVGGWLYGSDANKTSEMKGALKRAIASLPALRSKSTQERVPKVDSEEVLRIVLGALTSGRDIPSVVVIGEAVDTRDAALSQQDEQASRVGGRKR